MGTKYYYEGNNNPRELTEKITGIGPDGEDELALGGGSGELTDEQHAQLSSNYRLVSEEQRAEQQKTESEGTASSPADTSSTPDTSSGSGGESEGADDGAGESSTPEPSAAASSGAGRRGGRQT